MTQAIKNLFQDTQAIKDPVERFRSLEALGESMRAAEEQIVRAKGECLREIRSRDKGSSWAEIGSIFGVSGQRAHKLASYQPIGKEWTKKILPPKLP